MKLKPPTIKKYSLGIQQVDIPPGSNTSNMYNEMQTQMAKGAQEGQTAGLSIPIFGGLMQRSMQRDGLAYGKNRADIQMATADAQKRAAQQINSSNALQQEQYGAIQSGIQLTPSDLLTYDSTRMAAKGAQNTDNIPVEIEKNELVFDNYKLVDHAIGGKSHNQSNPDSPTGTGEFRVLEEGSTIIPKKFFSHVYNMLDGGGFIKPEMRPLFDNIVDSLPEDVDTKGNYFMGIESLLQGGGLEGITGGISPEGLKNIQASVPTGSGGLGNILQGSISGEGGGGLGNILQGVSNVVNPVQLASPPNSNTMYNPSSITNTQPQPSIPNTANFTGNSILNQGATQNQPVVQSDNQTTAQGNTQSTTPPPPANENASKVGKGINMALNQAAGMNPYVKAAKLGIDVADKFITTDAQNQIQGMNDTLGSMGRDNRQLDTSQWAANDYLQAENGTKSLKNSDLKKIILSAIGVQLDTPSSSPESNKIDFGEDYFSGDIEGYGCGSSGIKKYFDGTNELVPEEKRTAITTPPTLFNSSPPKDYKGKRTVKDIGSATTADVSGLDDVYRNWQYMWKTRTPNNQSLKWHPQQRDISSDMFGHIMGKRNAFNAAETFWEGDVQGYLDAFRNQQNQWAKGMKAKKGIDIPLLPKGHYKSIEDFVSNYGNDPYTYYRAPGQETPDMASWKMTRHDYLPPQQAAAPQQLQTQIPAVTEEPIIGKIEPMNTRSLPNEIPITPPSYESPNIPLEDKTVPNRQYNPKIQIPEMPMLNSLQRTITPGPLTTSPITVDPTRVRLEEKNVDNTDLNRAIQQRQIANRSIVQNAGAQGLLGFGGLASSIANAAEGVSNLEIAKAQRLNQVKDSNVDIRNQERLLNADALEKAKNFNAISRQEANAENISSIRDYQQRYQRDRQQDLYNKYANYDFARTQKLDKENDLLRREMFRKEGFTSLDPKTIRNPFYKADSILDPEKRSILSKGKDNVIGGVTNIFKKGDQEYRETENPTSTPLGTLSPIYDLNTSNFEKLQRPTQNSLEGTMQSQNININNQSQYVPPQYPEQNQDITRPITSIEDVVSRPPITSITQPKLINNIQNIKPYIPEMPTQIDEELQNEADYIQYQRARKKGITPIQNPNNRIFTQPKFDIKSLIPLNPNQLMIKN